VGRQGTKSGPESSVLAGAAKYLEKFSRFVDDMQKFRASDFLQPVTERPEGEGDDEDDLKKHLSLVDLNMEIASRFLCLLAAMLCGSSIGVPAVACPSPKGTRASIFKSNDKVFMAFFPSLSFVTVVTQPVSGARELVVATVRTIQLREMVPGQTVDDFMTMFTPWIRGGAGAGASAAGFYLKNLTYKEEEELFLEPVVTTWDSAAAEWAPIKKGPFPNDAIVNLADFLYVMPTPGKGHTKYVVALKGPDPSRPVPGAPSQIAVVIPHFSQRRVMGVPPPPGCLYSFSFASSA